MTRALNVLLVAFVAAAAMLIMLLGEPSRNPVATAAFDSPARAPSPSLVASPRLIASPDRVDSRALTVRPDAEVSRVGADRSRPVDETRRAEAPPRDRATPSPTAPVTMPLPFGQQRTVTPASPASANDTRRRLTQTIQIELHRVGCYNGAVDGEWGEASQRAMRAFNERINAALPIHQPDYILLTLLQGHAKLACGAPCPLGQIATGDGVCQPQSVVAEARRRASQSETVAPEARRSGHDDVGSGQEAVAAWARTMAGVAAPVSAPDRAAAATASRQALLEAERARIAAVQQRKRQQASEAQARLEGQRLAQRAEAEKARTIAEARRREELSALADRRKQKAADRLANRPADQRRDAPVERLARVIDPSRPPAGDPAWPVTPHGLATPSATANTRAQQQAAATIAPTPRLTPPTEGPHSSASGTLSSATTAPGLILPNLGAPGPKTGATEPTANGTAAAAIAPAAVQAALSQRAALKLAPSGPRYVGRFIPPPTYRVGRLPPRGKPSPQPVVRAVVVQRRTNPQRIFGYVQHHAP